MSEEKTKKKRGIGQIMWPLLLASALLILWIIYWQGASFLNLGSRAEIEMTPVPESVTVSSDADSDGNDDASDSESAETENTNFESSDSATDTVMDNISTEDASDGDASADQNAINSDANAETVTGTNNTGTNNTGTNSDDANSNNASAVGATGGDDNFEVSNIVADTADGDSSQFAIPLNSNLTVVDAAAESEDEGLRLYAMASLDAPTREVYNPGDSFRLVEPGSDFERYPVEVDGISWMRIRDENGLLGWADSSLLTAK